MLVSIVIPVYNVEEYLHYAMESLQKQTYKEFEVILVNDGSTDRSGELCDEYSEKYGNVFSYHKKNGGLSDARNFGIEKCKGDFITFLDPDDYLESFALELLVRIQKNNNVDIVSTRVKVVDKYDVYSKRVIGEDDFNRVTIMDKKQFLIEAFYDEIATVSACGKLYKKEVLQAPFPKAKIYEDLYIITEHLKNVDKVAHTDIKIYNYYQRPGSIVNSNFTAKQYDFFGAIENNREIIYKDYGNDKELQEAVSIKEAKGSFKISESAFQKNIEDVLKIRSILKKKYKIILNNSRVSLKFKFKYSLFILSPRYFYRIKKVAKGGLYGK